MLQYNIIVYESMQLADITADAYKDKLISRFANPSISNRPYPYDTSTEDDWLVV